MYVSHKLILKA